MIWKQKRRRDVIWWKDILKALCTWLVAQDSIIRCLNIERGKNIDLNNVCPLKIRDVCISILFDEYACDLPQMLNTAYRASAY